MGATSARGIALLVGAVLLGIVLLRATDPPDSLADASEGPVRESTTTSTTVTSTTEEQEDEAPPSSSTTEEPADEQAPLVLVANGAAGTQGVAGRLSQAVEQADFVTAPPANALEDVATSTVYFAPGFEDAAADVAELFDPAPATAPLPDPPPVSAGDLAGANVVLVAGSDLAR